MFNSVVLDVVIGLVFIYLLYSLMATILSELIATMLGLRARNLKEAIDRMLNDEKPSNPLIRLLDTLNVLKNPKNRIVKAFYNHPEIKYLGSSGLFKIPSNIKSQSFSKALMSLMFEKDVATPDKIENKLKHPAIPVKADKEKKGKKSFFKTLKSIFTWPVILSGLKRLFVPVKDENVKLVPQELGPETAAYIQGLWLESQGDIEKFRKLLEEWFDRTMENTIEWYKRKTRAITLILGLLLAWFFNADTFVIVKSLSNDKQAREQMVSMANTYLESKQYELDMDIIQSKNDTFTKQRVDTLLAVRNKLESDMLKANTILGTGCRLPAEFKITRDTIKVKDNSGKMINMITLTSVPPVDSKYLEKKYSNVKSPVVKPEPRDQRSYLIWLLLHHFSGYLITALAISLGAPFWFDLLSKVMSLRTSKKEPANSQQSGTASASEVSPLNRVG